RPRPRLRLWLSCGHATGTPVDGRILSVFQATCNRSPRGDLLNEAAVRVTGPHDVHARLANTPIPPAGGRASLVRLPSSLWSPFPARSAGAATFHQPAASR